MDPIDLAEPETAGPIERAIADRESQRTFGDEPLTLDDISTLLWAAQGISHVRDGTDLRTVPSAGATYPLEVFLEVDTDEVASLEPGLYQYEPVDHELRPHVSGSRCQSIVEAALKQPVVAAAPTMLAIAADYDRTTTEYPDHGRRYVHMEAGHAAQSVQLCCVARDLACCPVGAFRDGALAEALALPDQLDPLYLLPVGTPDD